MSACAYVSTFENLVKPLAPPFITFVRKVISGYFLTLSNTCDGGIFGFLVVIPKFDPLTGNPLDVYSDREITISGGGIGAPFDPSGVANHQAIFDITGGTSSGQTDTGELIYLGETDCVRIYRSKRYEICSGATAGFRILPNLNDPPGNLQRERLEYRGYVVAGLYSGLPQISPDPGASASFELILTPEQRGTFLPLDVDTPLDPVDLGAISQLNTSLAPAQGATVPLALHGNPTPENVLKFIDANGIPEDDVRPFNDCLRKIV